MSKAEAMLIVAASKARVVLFGTRDIEISLRRVASKEVLGKTYMMETGTMETSPFWNMPFTLDLQFERT